MSFNAEVRKVRDRERLPAHRLNAFANCLTAYSPIGFHHTWAFLESKAGALRTSENSLLSAVDLLEDSHRRYLAELSAYAQVRRRQKSRGLRFPPRGQTTPLQPLRWHAAPREAADFILRHRWNGELDPDVKRDEIAPVVSGLLTGYLKNNMLMADQNRQLRECLAVLWRRRSAEAWYRDPTAFFRAVTLGRLAEHLQVATESY